MKQIMSKSKFKTRWESSSDGGGITFDEISDCAKAWNICKTPRTRPIAEIRYLVLKAADTVDAEEFNPTNLPL